MEQNPASHNEAPRPHEALVGCSLKGLARLNDASSTVLSSSFFFRTLVLNGCACDLLRAYLSEGYEVIDPQDPELALGLALEHKPDATLLDLMMPKFSGSEQCQSFRFLSYTSRIPVLVITGRRVRNISTTVVLLRTLRSPLKLNELRRRLTGPKRENGSQTQDGRKLRRYKRCWCVERWFA